eukprot:g4119.t1
MDTPPFSELGLPEDLLAAIEKLGYEKPSPIQAKSIPPALEGKDILGLSATGSGKTAAFTLPALTKIDVNDRHPQVLILCPTRELAVQVCEEVNRLGSQMKGLHATPVYGGAPIDRQLRALRDGAQLVVGTPGRLLDHMKRGSFKADKIKMAVLDEADRMLDMGFKEEMDEILAALPQERQILFFSATMNQGVSRFIKKFGNDPVLVEIEQKAKTVSTIEQSYFEVRNRSKVEVLSRILDMNPPRLGIIFCNTKRSVDECTEALVNRGYAADRLHGDITQQMRERVLKRFRDGSVELLVATDVAARGLDIEEIDIVFNYDIPTDQEDYVHRIGRTGRAGRSGRAVSFVFGREIYRLQSIERYTRQVIKREKIPSVEQVEGRRADLIFEALKERLETGSFDSYQENIDRLLEQGHTPTDIAGALITTLREASGREGFEIQEDREPDGPKTDRRKSRDDRGAREDRGPRERRDRSDRGGQPYERSGKRDAGPVEGGMTRLFLSLGKGAGVMPKDIVGMMYREAGLPDGSLGRITLFPKHCLVDVPEGLADQAIEKTRNAKLRGKTFRMDHDHTLGRKTLLVAAAVLMICEMGCLLFAPRDGGWILVGLCVLNRLLSGLSEAAASGADEALAYDSLPEGEKDNLWDEVLSKAMRYRAVAFVIAMIIGGLMYDSSILNRILPASLQIPASLAHRLPVALVLLQGVACLAISLSMVEPRRFLEVTFWNACGRAIKLTLRTAKWVFTNPRTRVFVIIGLAIDSVIRNFATITSSYYRLIDLPEWTFGFIGAAVGLGGIVVPTIARWLNRRVSPLGNFSLIAVAGLLGLVGLVPANSYWCLLPAMMLMMTISFLGFTMSRSLNREADSSRRATVLSVKGLAFNLGYGIFSLGFSGLLAGLQGNPEGTSLAAALFWQMFLDERTDADPEDSDQSSHDEKPETPANDRGTDQ